MSHQKTREAELARLREEMYRKDLEHVEEQRGLLRRLEDENLRARHATAMALTLECENKELKESCAEEIENKRSSRGPRKPVVVVTQALMRSDVAELRAELDMLRLEKQRLENKIVALGGVGSPRRSHHTRSSRASWGPEGRPMTIHSTDVNVPTQAVVMNGQTIAVEPDQPHPVHCGTNFESRPPLVPILSLNQVQSGLSPEEDEGRVTDRPQVCAQSNLDDELRGMIGSAYGSANDWLSPRPPNPLGEKVSLGSVPIAAAQTTSGVQTEEPTPRIRPKNKSENVDVACAFPFCCSTRI